MILGFRNLRARLVRSSLGSVQSGVGPVWGRSCLGSVLSGVGGSRILRCVEGKLQQAVNTPARTISPIILPRRKQVI